MYMCVLLFTLFDFSFCSSFLWTVLWYCWLGLLTCKNRLPYNLYCAGGDEKHCSIQSINENAVSERMQVVHCCMMCYGGCSSGLFIIDDKGTLRQITVNDLPVGRSVDEVMRLVQAFQFSDKHGEGTTALVVNVDCQWWQVMMSDNDVVISCPWASIYTKKVGGPWTQYGQNANLGNSYCSYKNLHQANTARSVSI